MTEKRINRRSAIVYSALLPEKLDDGIASGADIVVLDLEDGTAPDRKAEGREKVRPAFARDPGRPMQKMLRINNPRTADGMRDMLAILDWETPPDALLLPKVEQPDEVRLVADLLAPVHPEIEFMLIMETPLALENIYALTTAAPQVKAVLLGCDDFSGALGSDRAWDALAYARGRVVAACATAGIDAMDGPFYDPEDETGLVAELGRVASMGFTGKASYHARQIPHIHAAFTPTPEQIAQARRILDALAGNKVGIAQLDGRMINAAIAKGAKRVLAIAEKRGVLR